MALHALPADTVRLIKSTQVITTPLSIVKELVENSIDAEAKTVSVKLENYGFGRIEVRDNGKGINEEDVKVIAKPHFTSKIASFADLASLTSYGFRGEALSSLCAVADVTVTTKTKESSMGHIYTFTHHGDVASKKPAATPKGTSVVVSNLFKNVPVRRQYYNNSRRRKEELKKVEDLLLSFCMAAPDIHFTLVHDKNTMVQKNPAQGIEHVLMNVFPTVYKKMKSEAREIEDIKLEVFLPNKSFCNDQSVSRSAADRLFVIVNRRPVTHKSVEKLVKAHFIQSSEGCHGRYPIGVISVGLPPDDVDVNLEPNKNKVLLKSEETLLESLQDILQKMYGPLQQPTNKSSQKNSSSQPAVVNTDITCTLACVTQQQSTNTNSNEEELSILDDFLKESLKDNVECQGNTEGKQSLEERLSKDYCMYSNKENESFFENCGTAPLTAGGREKQSPNTPLDKVLVMRPEMPTDESIVECGRSHLTSTQTSKLPIADRDMPSLSLSTIHSGEKTIEIHPSVSSASFVSLGGSLISNRPDISDIKPLSVSSSSGSSVQCEGRKDMSSEDLGESLLVPSAKDRNKSTLLDVEKEASSQLHTTVMGSDGIPVYKIMPFGDGVMLNNDTDEPKPSAPGVSTSGESSHKLSLQAVEKAVDLCDTSPEKIMQQTEIQAKQSLGNTDSERSLKGSWSRGHITMGDNIQTVQLVTPKIVKDSPQKKQPETNALKRLLPPASPGKQLSPLPSKKMKHEALSPTSYEYVNGKSVKRPASAFILYSRDIRRTVLQENPGKDFAFIAKTMADRWKTADAKTKQHYKDLSDAESRRYQEEIRKIREIRSMNDSVLDRSNISRTTLDKFVAPLTPVLTKKEGKNNRKETEINKHPWRSKTKDFKIDMKRMRERLKTPVVRELCGPFHLLGPLTKCGGWLCQENGKITALNTSRLHEAILAQTLMNSFNLKPKDLDDPMPFNASTIGIQEWATLTKMPMDMQEDRRLYLVNDRRLLANGFKVALYPASSGDALSHGEIVGMANCIGFYGLNDFKEIMSIITSNPNAGIARSRPLKVQHWLRGETVRMIRSGPNVIKKDDVLEKLEQWQKMQGGVDEELRPSEWKNQKCLHSKPFFTPIYSLDDLPPTPSQG